MATASGIDAQLSIVAESTFGTYAAPTRSHEILSESLKLDIDQLVSKGIKAGRRVTHRRALGAQRVNGGWEMELPPQGTGLLFKHMFGAVSTSGSNPYTHTFTPGALDALSLTVQVGRPDTSGTVRVFSYLGFQITDWELACAVNEIVALKVNGQGTHEDTGQSLVSATYASGLSPFVYTHGSLTIAGSAQDVKEITIKGDNGRATNRHLVSATTPARPKSALESELREYSGEIACEFESLTAYNRFVAGTEAALVLTFNAGSSAQLTITTNVVFVGETPNVSGHELLELSLPFECTSGTSDAAAITAALVNADSSP